MVKLFSAVTNLYLAGLASPNIRRRNVMVAKITVLELLARSVLYSLVVILIDFVLLFAVQGNLNQIAFTLSLLMLLEGGISLTVGGAVAFYSPVGANISEILFHSKPWTAQRQREAEKQARTWIATGIILVLASFVVSAF
ncbi:MAG: hypothetical protein QXX34_08320 [Candidatus Bathyarchaeia archaeon]